MLGSSLFLIIHSTKNEIEIKNISYPEFFHECSFDDNNTYDYEFDVDWNVFNSFSAAVHSG